MKTTTRLEKCFSLLAVFFFFMRFFFFLCVCPQFGFACGTATSCFVNRGRGCVTYVNRESVLSTCRRRSFVTTHTTHISLGRVFALETWVCWLPQEVLVRFSLPLLALVLLLSSIFFFFYFASILFCGFLHS